MHAVDINILASVYPPQLLNLPINVTSAALYIFLVLKVNDLVWPTTSK